jgi:hypothetical protein
MPERKPFHPIGSDHLTILQSRQVIFYYQKNGAEGRKGDYHKDDEGPVIFFKSREV